MRIALMVEELLTPTNSVRQGILEFLQATVRRAETAFVVVDGTGGNREIVPYTTDLNTLWSRASARCPYRCAGTPVSCRKGFSRRPPRLRESLPRRPVIVVIAMALNAPAQRSLQQPQGVLDRLRDGNAQLHVVSVQAPRSPGVADNYTDSPESSLNVPVLSPSFSAGTPRRFSIVSCRLVSGVCSG